MPCYADSVSLMLIFLMVTENEMTSLALLAFNAV